MNSKGKTETLDTDITAFLKYVNGKAAESTFTKEIAQEVIRVKKHDKTRREYMTYATELKQWKRKCLAEGLAEGEKKAKKETIINLAQIHMPKETIAQVTKSSIDYVEEVIRNANQTIS